MLRACVLDDGSNWEMTLPLVEFAYNNSFQATIGMAPYEALYKIREKIKISQDRQKSYADRHRRDLHFEVGENVFLKVAPMKGIIRFGKKGKLRPRFVGPFEILERSKLWKYVHDPRHIIDYSTLEVNRDLTYDEMPSAILEKKVHKLRNKDITLLKVQWNRHGKDEATWEREDEIRA
ncbi:hypothetical protein DH2020_042399 [Rehmannia glutinosa]|uniref:Tf2-1-like SH3-like domain-containing protein n=1 Tax=Rehmannia glutinosa TaxID=99300 RepID=A0ABR0UMG6_REHGL